MNEFYNGGFAPEFSVSMLKETIALVLFLPHFGSCQNWVSSANLVAEIQNVGETELSEEKI